MSRNALYKKRTLREMCDDLNSWRVAALSIMNESMRDDEKQIAELCGMTEIQYLDNKVKARTCELIED